MLRVETTGAVIRPTREPDGDLLPGADDTRFAVQGFVDSSLPEGPGVTIAPLDAFALRTDLAPITFEALGNDQNYREVCRDQGGVTEFRFRYSLRAHEGPYDSAASFAWSRCMAMPLLVGRGDLPSGLPMASPVVLDPARALATCLKPAEEKAGAILLRLWETAGRTGPLTVEVPGTRHVMLTDLLERELRPLPVRDGRVTVDLRAHGFCALRLDP